MCWAERKNETERVREREEILERERASKQASERKLITVYDCDYFSKIILLKSPSIHLNCESPLVVYMKCVHWIEWHTRICSSAITIETINWNETFRSAVIKLTFSFWFMFKRWKDLRRYLLESTYRLRLSSPQLFSSPQFCLFLSLVRFFSWKRSM